MIMYSQDSLKAGAVVKAVGVGVQTLHYYERLGLLQKPKRSAANYRLYAPEAARFPLAKIAKEAGVTEDRLAQPKTPADFDKVEENRKVAIEGMKAGLQSGQTVPYP